MATILDSTDLGLFLPYKKTASHHSSLETKLSNSAWAHPSTVYWAFLQDALDIGGP
jgi:hypothetical protein